MKIIRAARVLFPVMALFSLVTCGGSSSTNSGTGGVGAGGKPDNTGGKSSAGGNTGSGGISGGVGGASGGPRKCGSSGGNGTCTAAETNAYSMCVSTACDTPYKACLGPDYKNGNYTGVCAAAFQCQDKCACGDTACLIACGLPSAACTTCLADLATCSATCPEPACYTTGNGGVSGGLGGIFGGLGGIFGGLGGIGGGATCADLLACCDRASATFKPSCMAAYTGALASGDVACSLSLSGIKALICP